MMSQKIIWLAAVKVMLIIVPIRLFQAKAGAMASGPIINRGMMVASVTVSM